MFVGGDDGIMFWFYVVLVVLELRSKLVVALELAGVADSGMA